jgi:GxxExxY protein
MEELNRISGQIIDAAMKVHSKLRPGLLESAYQACLIFELQRRSIRARPQVELPIRYDDVLIEVGYRLDLLVEEEVVSSLNRSRPLIQSMKHSSCPISS